MSPDPRRILLIKLSSLGDIVHTLPALAALRKRFPSARIDWLVARGYEDLLEGHPALDATLVFEREWVAGFRVNRHLLRGLRSGRYDVVLDFQGLFRSSLLAFLARAPRRIGFANGRELSPWFYTERVAPPPDRPHAVDRYLALLEPLGIRESAAEFPLSWGAGVEDAVSALLVDGGEDRPLAALHPFGRWPTKQWEHGRYLAVAQRLASSGWRVAFVGGGGHRADVKRWLGSDSPRVMNLVGKVSLKGLAALLKRARVLVTNDSGPMHLAVAVGTPVVALFGPTDPARTGPYGEQGKVLRTAISCSPCFSRSCSHRSCMTEIGVEEVLAAVEKVTGTYLKIGFA
jgi:predicted lipopolysaccharide heptosyltransferase III